LKDRFQTLITALIILAILAAGVLSAVWLKSRAAILFNWRGHSHYAQQDWDKVVHDMTVAIRLNPKNPDSYRYRAYAYQMKGENDKAIADCGTLIALQPKDPWAFEVQANLLATQGDLAGAMQDYDKLIELAPEDAENYNYRGSAYLRLRDWNRAVADFNEALRRDPGHIRARANRGYALEMLNQNAAALEDFREALRRDPKDPEANNALAWVRATCPEEAIRNGDEAIRLALKACEYSRWQNSSFVDTLAAAYAETGDYTNAVKFQQRALDDKDVPAATRQEMESRLALYREGKPYRETIPIEKK
jgi:tetratricopeptide (TPR) repeat protein